MPNTYLTDDLTALGAKRGALSNIGSRVFGTRMEYQYSFAATGPNAADARTWAVRTVAAAPTFVAVRIRLALGLAAASPITPTFQCAIAALPNKSDAAIAAANYIIATFNGAGQPTLAPSTNLTRVVDMVSDWMPVVSVARDDGGSLPMLDLQCGMWAGAAAGNVAIMGAAGGADSYLNWATRPDGRIWDIRTKSASAAFAAAGTGNQMTAAGTSAANHCPIIGFDYLTEYGVISVAAFGDSITAGRSTYLQEGFGFPAVLARQAATGIPHEFANFGWSGQTSANIRQHVVDRMASGNRFDAALIPNYSPNDGGAPLTQALIDGMRGNLGRSMAALRGAGVQPIIWTGIPTNTAVKAWGASDALRVASNTRTKAAAAAGGIIADTAAVMSGAVDGNGQVQLLGDGDGIHPGDSGNATMSVPVRNAIERTCTPLAGAVY